MAKHTSTIGIKALLNDTLLLFCTDNSVVEAAIYKGSSTSPKLHDMVIEFYALQFQYGFSCIVNHVSGNGMIAQGSNGLSRGTIMKVL